MIFTCYELKLIIKNNPEEFKKILKELDVNDEKFKAENFEPDNNSYLDALTEEIDKKIMRLLNNNNLFSGLRQLLKKIGNETLSLDINIIIDEVIKNKVDIIKAYRGDI